MKDAHCVWPWKWKTQTLQRRRTNWTYWWIYHNSSRMGFKPVIFRCLCKLVAVWSADATVTFTHVWSAACPHQSWWCHKVTTPAERSTLCRDAAAQTQGGGTCFSQDARGGVEGLGSHLLRCFCFTFVCLLDIQTVHLLLFCLDSKQKEGNHYQSATLTINDHV